MIMISQQNNKGEYQGGTHSICMLAYGSETAESSGILAPLSEKCATLKSRAWERGLSVKAMYVDLVP